MKITKIKLSEVLKKDLKVVGYLLIFGIVTVLSERYLKTGELSVLLGGAANYIVYRVTQELNNEGYKEALSK